MTRSVLIERTRKRKDDLWISLNNISELSNLWTRTVARFFAGEDVKISTVEWITKILWLDFSWNPTISKDELINKKAEEKALYIVWLVQDTSSLEEQWLDDNDLKILIEKTKNEFLNSKYKKKLWNK